ncbi:hypothetical protein Tco_0952654 [Tanacetum coccineum]|uniref:Uncharacterized protein n=1 Tax=Tanacetum coccineum TaxID=301880 RepID=A0ABQ5DYJ0_9ASTR
MALEIPFEDESNNIQDEKERRRYSEKRYAFADSVFHNKEDTGTRIEPESHNEHPETVYDDIEKEKKDDEKDDDDNNVNKEMKNDDVEKKKDDVKDDENDHDDDHDDHALIKNTMSGSMETMNEQTQIPISSPPKSPRTELSLENTLFKELTTHVSPTPDTTSKDPSMTQPTSSTNKVLPGSIAELSRHQDKTNKLMKEAIPRIVDDAIEKDREIFADVVPELVSKEFTTHAPNIIEELFKRHMKNKVLNVHYTVSILTTTTTAELKTTVFEV